LECPASEASQATQSE